MADSLLNRAERQLDTLLPKVRILALGDSHTNRTVNPRIVKNTFNYASHGENYIQNYFKLKHLLKTKDHNIELLLLQLDMHNLYDNFNKEDNLYFWSQYIDPIDLAKVSKDWLDIPAFYYVYGNFISYISSLRVVFESFIRNSSEKLIEGFQPRGGLRPLEKKELKKRFNAHFKSNEKYVSDRSLTYFFKILDLAKHHNIKVALVSYPVSKYYYSVADQATSKKIFDKLAKLALEAYPNVEHHFDYSKVFFKDDLQNNKMSAFYDFDHLNIYGANIVSEHLCNKLEEKYSMCHGEDK